MTVMVRVWTKNNPQGYTTSTNVSEVVQALDATGKYQGRCPCCNRHSIIVKKMPCATDLNQAEKDYLNE